MGKNLKMQKAMEYSVYENLLVAVWDCGNDIMRHPLRFETGSSSGNSASGKNFK